MNDTTACVLYDEPLAARRAWKALRRAGIGRPRSMSIHQGEIWQDQYPLSQSRSRAGAITGAIAVGLPTAVILTIASSTPALQSLGSPTAFVVGLVGGGLLGGLTGLLVGATEPPPLLSQVEAAVRDGKVALVADFRSPEQARRAGLFLASRPGAASGALVAEAS